METLSQKQQQQEVAIPVALFMHFVPCKLYKKACNQHNQESSTFWVREIEGLGSGLYMHLCNTGYVAPQLAVLCKLLGTVHEVSSCMQLCAQDGCCYILFPNITHHTLLFGSYVKQIFSDNQQCTVTIVLILTI